MPNDDLWKRVVEIFTQSKYNEDVEDYLEDTKPSLIKKIIPCNHDEVALRSVHPVTLAPKRGKCKKCGKNVRAKVVWE